MDAHHRASAKLTRRSSRRQPSASTWKSMRVGGPSSGSSGVAPVSIAAATHAPTRSSNANPPPLRFLTGCAFAAVIGLWDIVHHFTLSFWHRHRPFLTLERALPRGVPPEGGETDPEVLCWCSRELYLL